MNITSDKLFQADCQMALIRDSADALLLIADGLDERCGKNSEEGRGVHYIAESLKQQVTALQELLLT